MPSGIPEGAMCVQRFDDSLNSAIHITYRISLRSSSMPEPRDPLLKVLFNLLKLRRRDAVLEGPRGRSPSKRQGRPRSNKLCSQRVGGNAAPGGATLLCNDPSAGSPTERLYIAHPEAGFSHVLTRHVSTAARLYLKQDDVPPTST